MSKTYRDLIESSRVSTVTRDALASRLVPDDPAYIPRVLDAMSLATLRALINRIIPQSPPHHIDLAARIDQQLAEDVGDGWRFAALPADPVAYRRGLRTLDSDGIRRVGAPFAQLPVPRQDEILSIAAAGGGGSDANVNRVADDGGEPSSHAGGSDEFNGAQLRAWFEEVRADAVKLYVAHPRTLARIGYTVSPMAATACRRAASCAWAAVNAKTGNRCPRPPRIYEARRHAFLRCRGDGRRDRNRHRRRGRTVAGAVGDRRSACRRPGGRSEP